MSLFCNEKCILNLPNAQLIYIPNFIETIEADLYFNYLKSNILWKQDDITVFGKTYKQPRLTALYANNQSAYTYSNITMNPHAMTKELMTLNKRVENEAQVNFTSVLLNFYRHGNDSNGWHADNEKELGVNPIIASLSFGAERPFHFKHRHIKDERHKLPLEHGSLLLMKGEMQHYWLHQIAKTKKDIGERINLTFRTIQPI